MTKEALKLALEALIGARAFLESDAPVEIWGVNDQAITAIKEALANEALEKKAENARELGLDYEPVACKECHLKDMVYDLLGDLKVANLKLSVRAKRTWVGLTDEEIWGAVSRIGTSNSDVNPYAILKDARAIEAKLKEKNT